jgi:hypothetical protein
MAVIQTRWKSFLTCSILTTVTVGKELLVSLLLNCRCNARNATRFVSCHVEDLPYLWSPWWHCVRCPANTWSATHSPTCTRDKEARYSSTLSKHPARSKLFYLHKTNKRNLIATGNGFTCSSFYNYSKSCLCKAIPVRALIGPEGCRKLMLPDFKTVGTWRW